MVEGDDFIKETANKVGTGIAATMAIKPDAPGVQPGDRQKIKITNIPNPDLQAVLVDFDSRNEETHLDRELERRVKKKKICRHEGKWGVKEARNFYREHGHFPYVKIYRGTDTGNDAQNGRLITRDLGNRGLDILYPLVNFGPETRVPDQVFLVSSFSGGTGSGYVTEIKEDVHRLRHGENRINIRRDATADFGITEIAALPEGYQIGEGQQKANQNYLTNAAYTLIKRLIDHAKDGKGNFLAAVDQLILFSNKVIEDAIKRKHKKNKYKEHGEDIDTLGEVYRKSNEKIMSFMRTAADAFKEEPVYGKSNLTPQEFFNTRGIGWLGHAESPIHKAEHEKELDTEEILKRTMKESLLPSEDGVCGMSVNIEREGKDPEEERREYKKYVDRCFDHVEKTGEKLQISDFDEVLWEYRAKYVTMIIQIDCDEISDNVRARIEQIVGSVFQNNPLRAIYYSKPSRRGDKEKVKVTTIATKTPMREMYNIILLGLKHMCGNDFNDKEFLSYVLGREGADKNKIFNFNKEDEEDEREPRVVGYVSEKAKFDKKFQASLSMSRNKDICLTDVEVLEVAGILRDLLREDRVKVEEFF